METVEESLNDTAQLLSASIESKLPRENFHSSKLKLFAAMILDSIFKNAKARVFEAKIYSLTKTKADLQCYVVDENGMVVFDSEGFREGLDYSKFNDVYLTLQGKYGARSSKLQDPTQEGALFVAAPINFQGRIIGAVTVIKPKIGVVPFIELAREKFWRISLVVAFSIAFLFTLLAYLMFRPIGKLSFYVSALRNKERVAFPKIGLRELEKLGTEIDFLVKDLEGKEYIEDYVQTLTHELKSPLSSILASAELLDTHPLEAHRLTENIHKEGKRIQQIIEQLLELSALEGKRVLKNLESIDLYALSSEAIQTFSAEKDKRQVTIEIQGENCFVEGDSNYLRICLHNLIRNSLEFSKPMDEIKIQIIKNNENKVELKVIDSGSTIPDYALERITERFYSLPRPDTKLKSSGLGLSIVKQICDLHHASFTIQNRVGTGVEVTLVFPS
jgi:two-component system sensor histidine kinase CreC